MRPKIYDEETAKWRTHYSRVKAQANFRREEWAFTYESWTHMWDQSGKREHRGRKPHQYCMVRKDPIEAWGPHNCIIVTRRMHLKKQAYEAIHNYEKRDWEDKHSV